MLSELVAVIPFAAVAVAGGLMVASATYHALALFGGRKDRRSEIERHDDEKKLRAAALLRAEAARLKTAADVFCALNFAEEELPPDVRRTLDEQDAEIFRAGNKQSALDRAETRWQELMDQASRLDWDARCRKAVRDEPVGLSDHIAAWAIVALLAAAFYWPIAIVVDAACTALGIDWAPPGF